MIDIDHKITTFIFDALANGIQPESAAKALRSFLVTENLYYSATREITTKLENLNDEFKHTKDRNPIHQINARVKTPRSIMNKLMRFGFDLNVDRARESLNDIAGIRVICSYIDDIYLIANLLTAQDDIELISTKDYIKKPKPNGYRSLHLIVTVPVFLSDSTERVKVEIQIRTIAMDFWASLEYELAYKLIDGKTDAISIELKDCADVIAATDIRMQNLFNNIGLSE
jgi:putative GTP pyrophosphokinase